PCSPGRFAGTSCWHSVSWGCGRRRGEATIASSHTSCSPPWRGSCTRRSSGDSGWSRRRCSSSTPVGRSPGWADRAAHGPGGAAAAVGALIGLSAGVLAGVESRQRYRAAEFFMAAKYEYEHAERGAALDELRAGLATAYRGPEQRTVPVDYVQLLQPLVVVAYELGRDAEARAALERLAHHYPADPTLRGRLAGPGK